MTAGSSHYWNLGLALVGSGRHGEAVEAFRQATNLGSGDPLPQAHLGWAVGLAGLRDEALTILTDLERRQSEGSSSAFLIAQCYVGLGDIDRALEWLDTAYDEHDGLCCYLACWPAMDPPSAPTPASKPS